MSLYGTELAAIHASGFEQRAEAGAATLLRSLIRWRRPVGQIVELACGAGRSSERLTRAGWPVIGTDLSPAMIELAKTRAPNADFSVADMLTYAVPKDAAAITIFNEGLNYPSAEDIATAGGLSAIFTRWREALQPGGILMFDLIGPGSGGEDGSYTTGREGDGWSLVATIEEAVDHKTLTRTISCFMPVQGDEYRRVREVHVVQLYRPETILAALDEAGLNAEVLPGYEGAPSKTGWYTFLARKPV
ncbi:class I SAM-dependent methyltransferase [Lacibacterium aquatile]|uniref:Class I SAM-dependent methyltransferase n=1 Tax=Lacibacterium aquatile TaxID=1168082 RepID=A0ABW5DVN2_9PROT